MRKFTGSSLVPRLGNGDRAKIPYSGSCGDEEQRKSRSLLQTRYHKAIHSIKFQDNIRKFRQMQDTRFLSTLEGFSAYNFSRIICKYMALFLTHVSGNPLINEVRLAAIVRQAEPDNNQFNQPCAEIELVGG
jgi:hypothetical protein